MTVTAVEWQRVAPVLPCTSPDGHEHVDILTAASRIPIRSRCRRCAQDWQIVVLHAQSSIAGASS